MKVVILAAGMGSRLWPLSTSEKPKQFQPLIYGESLLCYTYKQLSKIIATDDIYVQTLDGLEPHIYDQIPGIDKNHILLVPERRDTLAETLWAVNILSRSTDEPILIKSVDQYMLDSGSFLASLESSIKQYDAAKPAVTLLCSDYDEYMANSGYCTVNSLYDITSFIEKPTKSGVDKLLKQGPVYRSLFLFIASYSSLLSAIDGIDQPWARLSERLLKSTPEQIKNCFLDMPLIDLSRTIFQSSSRLKLAPLGHSHNFLDVGRYSALYDLNDKDANANVILGKVILGEDCHNNFIVNQTSVPMVVNSIRDSVVIQTTSGSFTSSLKDAGRIGEIYKQQIYSK